MTAGPRAETVSDGAASAASIAVAVPARRGERVAAFGGGVLAAFFFAGNFVSGRHAALAGLTPADVVALRFAVAALLFAPLLLRQGFLHLAGIGWGRSGVLAVLVGAPNILITMAGLRLAPAAHGALLSPALTIIAGVLLSIFLLHERPPRTAALGVPLALVGLILVGGAGLAAGQPETWRGDVLLAATGAVYGLFTVLVRRWQIPALPAAAVINVLSAAVWLPLYLASGAAAALVAAPLAEIVGQAIFQGVFVSGLGIILYARAVRVLGAARTAMFPALVPVFGTLLAAAVLGERVAPPQVAGIALVALGLLGASWPAPRRAPLN